MAREVLARDVLRTPQRTEFDGPSRATADQSICDSVHGPFI